MKINNTEKCPEKKGKKGRERETERDRERERKRRDRVGVIKLASTVTEDERGCTD